MKRPGRKRERSQPSNNDRDRDRLNRTVESHGSDSYLTTLDLSPVSSRLNSLSGSTECTSSDAFSSLLMPLEPNVTSVFDRDNDIFDSFLTSPIDLLELESIDFLNHNPDAISEASSLDRPNTSKSSSLSSNAQSLLNGNTGVSEALDLASCCLVQALDLMRKLSSTNSNVCILANGQNDVATVSNMGTDGNISAQTVVAENQQTFEAISNMLQCSCAEDSYVLTILSMIVLKTLERYAAAARRQSGAAGEKGEKPNTSTSTKEQVRQISGINDESVGRLEAQLILGELHRAQRLVKQLSPKLKARGGEAGGKGGGGVDRETSRGDLQPSSLSEGRATKAPFSSTIFEQIEVDLRKALSTLSSEIITMLRQS